MRTNSSKKENAVKRRSVWIFVADAENKHDLSDLDHLDAMLWGANPNTRVGDLVLMYRTSPYSDIAYVFTAASDPRPRRGKQAHSKSVIQLSDKIRLIRPLKLKRLRSTAALSNWSFTRTPQGIMGRKRDLIDEGVWSTLRQLIIRSNPYVAPVLKAVTPTKTRSRVQPRKPKARTSRRRSLKVFLSYGSPDLKRVEHLFRRLRRRDWIEPWFNKETNDLTAGDNWEKIVPEKIRSSDAVIICLSSKSVRRAGFFQSEIGRALRVQDQQPEGTTFISPVKFDDCEVPNRLAIWHCSELFRKRGFADLIAALERRASFLAQVS